MATKTATIIVRLEPEVKERADRILARMGMTTSSATNIFLHQVIQEGGLPFKPRTAKPDIPDLDELSKEEVKAILKDAVKEIDEGKVRPFKEVAAEMEAKYGFRI